MGTAAGFFGVTAQGAVNGLASLSLSIFNMDHPNDRAWLNKAFQTVAPDGGLRKEQVTDLLKCFYLHRYEGPTQSGSYLRSFPSEELDYVCSLINPEPDSTISFLDLLAGLNHAQDNFAEPAAALEYASGETLRNDRLKHTRRVRGPQQCSRVPMTTSQEVGWDAYRVLPDDVEELAGNPFHLRTSANTQFADAQEKHTWGRSIGGEFSRYGMHKLLETGGFGMGI